jgi:outer membrane protein TolC
MKTATAAACAAAVVWATLASAQSTPPTPTIRLTFKEAVDQAQRANPTVQQAAAEILRARAALSQATSVILPGVSASVTNVTLNTGRSFNGQVTTPQNQVTAALGVTVPLVTPVQWAQRTQARDVIHVAESGEAEARRQVAFATAQAYLAIIARRRVFEADVRARDTAKAHYQLAQQQHTAGSGSLVNELRAQQLLSSQEVLVEEASFEVYRAQEALGVLVARDGPVDVVDDPVLDVPQALGPAIAAMPSLRSDVRLFATREAAAERVWHDSWKDWLPSATALFAPQYAAPATIFQPSAAWRAQVGVSVPVFDAGSRRAVRSERRALFEESQFQYNATLRQANSDVRTANEAVSSAERSLAAARASAEQARHVVNIIDVSFKAGAATSIEVIDAQRALLDAETSVAVAEDQVRQARLTLLVALGRFP